MEIYEKLESYHWSLTGLFLLEDERLIIHSAHQFDTSQEAFERLVALVEGSPQLSKRLAPRGKGISRSHGAEGIRLRNGKRIRFRTRTKGGGRGFTCDCLILDEAMILPDAFVSATLPTLSSRPNPQVWYTGSAVDQEIHEHGLVLTRVRERGLSGDDNSLFYAEWSAADSVAEVSPAMAEDPTAWALANPALGIRISLENVEHERREFGSNLRGFAVERLGAGDWPDLTQEADRVISVEDWVAAADPASQIPGRLVFVFDVSPDRHGCISAAGIRADGKVHVEVIDHRAGTGWMVGRLLDLKKDHKPAAIGCDAGGPAASLLPELEQHEREIKITELGAKELTQSSVLFFDSCVEHEVVHLDQEDLNLAVAGAAKRSLGDSWAWSRKNSDVDISPLVSCSLALMLAKTGGGPVKVDSFSSWQARQTPEALAEKVKAREARMAEILAKGGQQ